MEHQERNDTVEEAVDVFFVPHARASTAGFASLDEVDLAEVFKVRVCVRKSIPKFMRGAFVASRISRAIGLANLGELSNARQALEGDAVAPGNERTWKLLTDENRRPRSVREPLNRRILSQDPPCPWMWMVICLFEDSTWRSSRRLIRCRTCSLKLRRSWREEG